MLRRAQSLSVGALNVGDDPCRRRRRPQACVGLTLNQDVLGSLLRGDTGAARRRWKT